MKIMLKGLRTPDGGFQHFCAASQCDFEGVFTSQLTVVTDGICLMTKIPIQPYSGSFDHETYERLVAEFLQSL